MSRRGLKLPLLVLGLALTAGAPAGADDVPWHGTFISPPVRAVSDGTASLPEPKADLPSPGEAAALKDCESAALYYGIGRPANPVAARKCAYLESRRGEGGPTLAGAPVLAMIYANGRGVRRNYDQAIALRPGYARAHSNRGNALSELGEFQAAIDSFDQALRMAPELTEAHLNRGNALVRLQQYTLAIRSYEAARACAPELIEAVFNKSIALQLMLLQTPAAAPH